MPEIKTKENQTANDGLALIIGGLFVLALVFATYSYFNKNKQSTNNVYTTTQESQSDNSLGNKIKELFNSQDNAQGELNGDGASTENTTDTSKTAQVQSASTNQNMNNNMTWVANNYQEGDITGNSYVVKAGDTLWEIAEAKYGSGFEWTRILDANKGEIGFLASGQQALIVPGQSLVLP